MYKFCFSRTELSKKKKILKLFKAKNEKSKKKEVVNRIQRSRIEGKYDLMTETDQVFKSG